MVKKRSKMALKPTETKNNESTPTEEKSGLWETLWGGVGQMEVPITEKQKIVFSLNRNEDTGDVMMDIRTHVTSKKYVGLTSKGISVPISQAVAFKKCFDKLISEAKALEVNK